MNTDHFQSLVHKHLDDAMSAQERGELEQRLLASPGARTEFWRIAKQHAALAVWGETHHETAPSFFKPRSSVRPGLRWSVGAFAVAAMVVGAGVVGFLEITKRTRRTVDPQMTSESKEPIQAAEKPGQPTSTASGAGSGVIVVQGQEPKSEPRREADIPPIKPATVAEVPGPPPTAANDRKTEGPNSSQPSTADLAKESESRKHLHDALARVSPEGRKILDEIHSPFGPPAPPELLPAELLVPKPGNDKGTAATPSPTGAGVGTQPQPMKPVPLALATKPVSRAVVDSGNAFFDSKTGFGVFVDDVVLDHPEFRLTADELELYMLPKDTAPKGEAPLAKGVNGEIKSAIAKGRKVVIIKRTPDGGTQTGIGREAVYDGATGDMILRGWPQIQKGNNLTVASEPTTYFILKADGHFYAKGGRAQTSIVQEPKH